MSNYLACVVECESKELANKICTLIDRKTRPIFDDDVEESDMDFFQVIELIEFPSYVLLDDTYVVLNWLGKDRFDFKNLNPLFEIKGVSLILVHEIDSYIGSGDEDEDEGGRYWFVKDQGVDSCNASELKKADFTHALELMSRHNG